MSKTQLFFFSMIRLTIHSCLLVLDQVLLKRFCTRSEHGLDYLHTDFHEQNSIVFSRWFGWLRSVVRLCSIEFCSTDLRFVYNTVWITCTPNFLSKTQLFFSQWFSPPRVIVRSRLIKFCSTEVRVFFFLIIRTYTPICMSKTWHFFFPMIQLAMRGCSLVLDKVLLQRLCTCSEHGLDNLYPECLEQISTFRFPADSVDCACLLAFVQSSFAQATSHMSMFW